MTLPRKSRIGTVDLRLGDCLHLLRDLPENTVDAVVTDPPAGIEFMGQAWDTFGAKQATASGSQTDAGCERPDGKKNPYAREATPRYREKTGASLLPFQNFICEVFTEIHRVLKPGGHMLVWAIPRTSHHTAMGIERAGFEIRDVVTHLFGQGFPKSLDVSKAFDRAAGVEREVVGQGRWAGREGAPSSTEKWRLRNERPRSETAPATPVAARWQGWGTALKPASEHWILARKPLDGTVAENVLEYGTGALNIDGCRIHSGPSRGGAVSGESALGQGSGWNPHNNRKTQIDRTMAAGRWPANVTLDEEAAAALDEQSGERPSGGVNGRRSGAPSVAKGAERPREYINGRTADSGGASRFFYVAKASKADRTANGTVENTHPTVKNTSLMRWLVRLITPPGGTVLDPFMGSGSTGVACIEEGFSFVGMEREKTFYRIAAQRIAKASHAA